MTLNAEAHRTDAVIGAGVFLSPAACALLHRLAEAGIQAARRSDAGGSVPPGTAHLLVALKAGARLGAGQSDGSLAAVVTVGSAPLAASAVLGAPSRHDVSTSEAAERWGCTVSYVRRLARRGSIPGAVRRGDAWRIPRAVLDAPPLTRSA